MSDERLRLTFHYLGGSSEAVYPALHPDISLEVQQRELRRWLIDRLMQEHPPALTLELDDPREGPASATFLPQQIQSFRLQIVRMRKPEESPVEAAFKLQPPHRKPVP